MITREDIDWVAVGAHDWRHDNNVVTREAWKKRNDEVVARMRESMADAVAHESLIQSGDCG